MFDCLISQSNLATAVTRTTATTPCHVAVSSNQAATVSRNAVTSALLVEAFQWGFDRLKSRSNQPVVVQVTAATGVTHVAEPYLTSVRLAAVRFFKFLVSGNPETVAISNFFFLKLFIVFSSSDSSLTATKI